MSWRDDKESAATSPKTFKRKVNELRQKKKKGETVSCSVMSDSATPWTVALQAPLSMGFSRQEY